MGLGLQGYSQGTPAITSFTAQTNSLAPDYRIVGIQAIDANTAWGLSGTLNAAGTSIDANTYLRTTNGGTTWTNGIIAPSGFTGYVAGNLFALNATTAWAAMFSAGASNGIIVKTTNGGSTWTAQTDPSTTGAYQFAAPAGFANWVYFWDANNGVCMGDPNRTSTSSVSFFEIYTTTNGGTTWTRTPRTSGLISNGNEYGVTNQYHVVGNTIWFSTLYDPETILSSARVFKSTDRGLTWTNSASNIPNRVSGIVFANANNGLLWNAENVSVTTNGGTSWATQSYTTPFRDSDVTSIPGGNTYVAVGLDARVASPTAADIGTSISRDYGATWTTIDNRAQYLSVSFASGTVGWAGGFSGTAGGGGIGKYTGANILSNRNAELQKTLAVYPNPSSNGVFTVQLASGLKSGATVRVVDVVGRQVASQQLNATALAAKSTTIDLSKEKAGIYTLELRTEAGVAQQKLVVE
ncbi:T9SS type A sorting domain-containing protein [Hymenobacter sp. BT186]|uniref:T9SS type A sorting domain-containing protein n=1 Tax=Hymenobacter telluris TaxID=2816474 RepID=A0A939ET07_9BACT|nr:T9SS type A sorting domain-containing protein [Hymenobacter telluris]MBO0356776.1 T9SS type A sorting domain-containing protein [Hymenobacter telluris]MBW3372802.1 T9SS type A sorting domain-containing protein [Hymenobacter norwichensis]